MHARRQAAFDAWVRFSSSCALMRLWAGSRPSLLLVHGLGRWRRCARDASTVGRMTSAARHLSRARAGHWALRRLRKHADGWRCPSSSVSLPLLHGLRRWRRNVPDAAAAIRLTAAAHHLSEVRAVRLTLQRLQGHATTRQSASLRSSLRVRHGFRRWRGHVPFLSARSRLGWAAAHFSCIREQRAAVDALRKHAKDQRWHGRARWLTLSRALSAWAETLAITPDIVAVARLQLRSRMGRWRGWARDQVLFRLRGCYRVFPRCRLVHWRAMATWWSRQLSACNSSHRHRLRTAFSSLRQARARGPQGGGHRAARLQLHARLAAGLWRWRLAAATALSRSRARLAGQVYFQRCAGARLFAALACFAAEAGDARAAGARLRRALATFFSDWADVARLLSAGCSMLRQAAVHEQSRARRRLLSVWQRAPRAVSAEARRSHRISEVARLRGSLRRLRLRAQSESDAVAGRTAIRQARREVRCALAFGRWREARARAALGLLRRAVARTFALPRALAAVRPWLRVWRSQAFTACSWECLSACAASALVSFQRRRCLGLLHAWGSRVRTAHLGGRARRAAQRAALAAALGAWRALASHGRWLPCAELMFRASRMRRRRAAGIAAWRTAVLCAHPRRLWPAQAARGALRTWRALWRVAETARTAARRWLRWRLSVCLRVWRRLPASERQARRLGILAMLLRRQLALPPAMLQWRCAAAVRAVYAAQRPRVRAYVRELRPEFAALCRRSTCAGSG